ncbi:MAG: hypothetical protein GPJ54_21190 [Candidatus Heimdallarchaeota archaeon]|nr:hypothetical protein [Candidatus Heimdallarchaeota archaeon]
MGKLYYSANLTLIMSEDEKKTLPKDILEEVKEADHPESGHDVSEMADALEGKIPTEKKED